MTRNLKCEPSTLAGPVDDRVVRNLQQRFELEFETEFLDFMALHHGGIPKIGVFQVGSTCRRIGQFLTLLDEESILTLPIRPHFEQGDTDERVVDGIWYLMTYDHMTSHALFKRLVPFASLDEKGMCLDLAYVDLLCLDYRNHRRSPSVVHWIAHIAGGAFMDWEEHLFDDGNDDSDKFSSVPWDDFVKPVADNFPEFLEMLEPVG